MNHTIATPPPALILRIEYLGLLAAVTLIYAQVAPDWGLYALLFFAPDIFMFGYAVNARFGSLIYNIGHTLTIPLAVLALGAASDATPLLQIGLIWAAHIAFDRAVGYGLKYPSAFKETHLQRV